MCDLCLDRVTAEVVRQRDISNPCCIRLVKSPHTPTLAKHTSMFDASASRVFEGASMPSDAEIYYLTMWV